MKRVINDCPKQVRSKIGRGFMSLKIARKLKFFSAQPASLCCPAANTLSLILQQVDQMFKSLITAISLFAMFFAVETHGQEPARVRVADGTLVSSDGKVLRGTTFFVDMYGVPDLRENETKYHEYFNSVFKKHPDLNCVRVGPWMGVWSLICFASLALMLFAGSISYWSQPKATVDAIGSLVLAVGFGTLAFFCCIHLATDCVRRRYLESVSRHDLRRRLRATPKSRKYVADPIHLRSMRIGGLFFGGCAVLALISKLLG